MKKNIILLSIFVIIVVMGMGVVSLYSSTPRRNENTENKLKIVTSFYPMYIATQNIVDGMDNVELVNLTESQVGCMHDYQLTTGDMRTLEGADVFIMNGGGMEGFVEEIAESFKDLIIIDASEGISLLKPEGHNHEEDHDHNHVEDEDEEHDHNHVEDEEHNHEQEDADHEHDHDEHAHHHDHGDNAHVWLNPDFYIKQIDNIAKGLVKADVNHASSYEKNSEVYQDEIKQLKENMREQLGSIKQQDVVIFHDAFAYLAQFLGLDVAYQVDMDGDSGLSAGQIKEVVDEVNLHDIKVLFTEQQYSESIADSIAKETNAKVYVIDSLVTGVMDKNAYINGMTKNISILKEALS